MEYSESNINCISRQENYDNRNNENSENNDEICEIDKSIKMKFNHPRDELLWILKQIMYR